MTPPAAAALVALLGVLQRGTAARRRDRPHLPGVLAVGIPLALGVAAGSLIGRDSGPESSSALCATTGARCCAG